MYAIESNPFAIVQKIFVFINTAKNMYTCALQIMEFGHNELADDSLSCKQL